MERQETEAVLNEVACDLSKIWKRALSAARGIRRLATKGGTDDSGQMLAVLAADRLMGILNAVEATERFLAPLWPTRVAAGEGGAE